MSLEVSGTIFAASSAGFTQLLAEANRVAKEGYELVSVISLDGGKSMGAVFRRKRDFQASSFFA
jgi:hypothetical protein